MRVRIAEAEGPTLDWAVAKCEGGIYEGPSVRDAFWIWPRADNEMPRYSKKAPAYSTDWAQGGPIIEREGLELFVHIIHNGVITGWACEKDWPSTYQKSATGPTPLIAAMRCYVASKLGDEIEVPSGLD